MSDPTLLCPHCGDASDDPFEVLDRDVVDTMRCERCESTFRFAIMECHACAGERAFSWRNEPAAEALPLLSCEDCGQRFRRDDATVHATLG